MPLIVAGTKPRRQAESGHAVLPLQTARQLPHAKVSLRPNGRRRTPRRSAHRRFVGWSHPLAHRSTGGSQIASALSGLGQGGSARISCCHSLLVGRWRVGRVEVAQGAWSATEQRGDAGPARRPRQEPSRSQSTCCDARQSKRPGTPGKDCRRSSWKAATASRNRRASQRKHRPPAISGASTEDERGSQATRHPPAVDWEGVDCMGRRGTPHVVPSRRRKENRTLALCRLVATARSRANEVLNGRRLQSLWRDGHNLDTESRCPGSRRSSQGRCRSTGRNPRGSAGPPRSATSAAG